MNKKQKNVLCRIIICAALLTATYLLPLQELIKDVLFVACYLIIGVDVLKKSAVNIKNGQVFDENFLMMIATMGALLTGEFGEAVFVILFYQVGELFQSIAVGRSRKSISDLMEICPEFAYIEKDGDYVKVEPESLHIGDIIVVRPGEKIPMDGTVVSGSSGIDTSNLTGESVPRQIAEGDSVLSGCINLSGVLKIRVEKEFYDSTVCKIMELVENATSAKAKTENFITKFAKYYTPAVVFAALAMALIVPLFNGQWSESLHNALVFLVISCPCALVISVPLSFFGGIGCASKNGILIKGSNYLEELSKCRSMVFDKTGTLTRGSFEVSEVIPSGISEAELTEICAYAESCSKHPIAQSIVKAYGKPFDNGRISDAEELSGRGMRITLDGSEVLAGNIKLMKENSIETEGAEDGTTCVYVSKDGKYIGRVTIADVIKDGAKTAIESLRRLGVTKTVMLTGDRRAVGEKVGGELGLDEVHAELLPADKISEMVKITEKNENGATAVYVGDGVNDAPVLARADVGIAMGSMGSDAAIEAADIVIMDDDIRRLPLALRISVKTIRIAKENIVFALAVKLAVLLLGAFGKATMWEAVFADVGVSVIAILNAMRCLGIKNK